MWMPNVSLKYIYVHKPSSPYFEFWLEIEAIGWTWVEQEELEQNV